MTCIISSAFKWPKEFLSRKVTGEVRFAALNSFTDAENDARGVCVILSAAKDLSRKRVYTRCLYGLSPLLLRKQSFHGQSYIVLG
jgi:hypothetical protein